jgi:hypothetical protein
MPGLRRGEFVAICINLENDNYLFAEVGFAKVRAGVAGQLQ